MTYQPTQPQVSSNNHTSSPEVALVAYQAYQETMRQFLALQEQVMMQFLSATSSRQIIPPPLIREQGEQGEQRKQGKRRILQSLPSTPSLPSLQVSPNTSVPPVPSSHSAPSDPSASSHPPDPLTDRATLTQTLLELVSDRTGYPIEMLGLDQDMEAELGIDSIKRVEILGALIKSLPQNLSASVQERMESFTQAKSLNGIVEQLLQDINKEASPAFSTQEGISLGKFHQGRYPAT